MLGNVDSNFLEVWFVNDSQISERRRDVVLNAYVETECPPDGNMCPPIDVDDIDYYYESLRPMLFT